MKSLKALGSDGMPPLFYKKYLNVVGRKLVNFVQEFCAIGKLNESINYTFIVLIHKVEMTCEFN